MNASRSHKPDASATTSHASWRVIAGQLAYACVFTIVLPVLLALWALALDRTIDLQTIAPPRWGAGIAIAGGVVMVSAVVALRVRGGGWPMSPYPPARLVTSSVYSLFGHPLYLGSVLLTLGLSIAAGIAAGAWIVTPALAAACISFVWGFEHGRTERLFGQREGQPLFRLPRAAGRRPEAADRLSTYFLAFGPWYVVYESINRLPTPADAISVVTPVDRLIPVLSWTELVYFSCYPLVLAAPLVARSSGDLRALVIRSWIATAGSALCYLGVPTMLPKKPLPLDGVFGSLLAWERGFHAPNTALPAFHVIWVILIAGIYVGAWPRLRVVIWPFVLAMAASCVTTGMHVIADVVAAIAMGLAFNEIDRIWRWLVRGTESLSNSWNEWRIGPFRLINHGLFGGLAAGAGMVLVSGFAGDQLRLEILAVAVASMIGAAVWAQVVEGSPVLLRPFGYYGGIIGGLLAIAFHSLTTGNGWPLMAGFAIAAPFIQAAGRLRCMIQGCCHGRPAESAYGVVVRHPRSRIVRLAGLSGVALHPTALYSAAANLTIGAVLVVLAGSGAPLAFVSGTYLILSGLARFVEEHYRGEPQTPTVAGLRIYQWLAIASVFGGALAMSFASPPALGWTGTSVVTIGTAFFFGLFALLAYGVDLPESNLRFSRLA